MLDNTSMSVIDRNIHYKNFVILLDIILGLSVTIFFAHGSHSLHEVSKMKHEVKVVSVGIPVLQLLKHLTDF